MPIYLQTQQLGKGVGRGTCPIRPMFAAKETFHLRGRHLESSHLPRCGKDAPLSASVCPSVKWGRKSRILVAKRLDASSRPQMSLQVARLALFSRLRPRGLLRLLTCHLTRHSKTRGAVPATGPPTRTARPCSRPRLTEAAHAHLL